MKELNTKIKQKIHTKNTLNNYLQNLPFQTFDLAQFHGSFQKAAQYYFQQAKYLYIDQLVLKRQLTRFNQDINDIELQIKRVKQSNLSKSQNQSGFHKQQKKRRKRRNASQIQRLYRCRAQGCQKSYGSQGTLAQHLKLKHPDLYIPPFGQNNDSRRVDRTLNDTQQENIYDEDESQSEQKYEK